MALSLKWDKLKVCKEKLYGYTVRGIDRRDNSPFEDHVVISDSDAAFYYDHLVYIMDFYNIRGLQVSRADIIPDEDPGYDPDKGVAIDLDLHQIYLDQLKVVKEQQNDFNSEEL